MIEATITEYATSSGIDRETLLRKWVKAGYNKPEPHKKFPLSEFVRVITDESPKDRLATARAIERERINRIAEGEVVEWERVAQWINQRIFAPMISAMDAAPKEVDREWLENVLKPLIRERIEPPPR